ncbi:MAG TPA: hypothetical protein VGM80_09310 [Gaiellaceae bacterium]|jgi:hypothetical protein
MRRICLIVLLVAFAAPAAALAIDRASADGSLSVSGASGTVVIQGNGVIYGHFDQGTLMVLSYKPDDGLSTPAVSSLRAKYTKGIGIFTGSDVRFLLPSGRYSIELIANGADITAVGAGKVVATSPAQPDVGTVLPFGSTVTGTGTVSVNGGKPIVLTKGSTYETFGGK